MSDTTNEVKVKPQKQTVSKPEVQCSIEQFFENSGLEVHYYTKAALVSVYRGILKTEEQWKIELESKV